MKKYLAEFIGTFSLVLLGCGTAVVAGLAIMKDAPTGTNVQVGVGVIGIALAFGFALVAMAYGIGPVSGCHINPAVSLGVFAAGRMKAVDLVGYVVAQFLGALAAAAVLAAILKGQIANADAVITSLGQNGWGPEYLGQYSMGSAILFELVATFLFLVVILGATQEGSATPLAGLAIGITLVVIHLFGIRITGTSVNPARSFGPALLVGGKALEQLWLFLIVPSLGGLAAGVLYRLKILGKS